MSPSSTLLSSAVSLLGCPQHPGGNWNMVTLWQAQSTSGLWWVSHECPMMMVCHPRFVTVRCAFSVCWPYWSMTSTSVMDPFSFGVPLTLWTGTGFGKGQVSSLCFWTKAQLMNIPVALELRRADMEVVVCVTTGVDGEVRSTVQH